MGTVRAESRRKSGIAVRKIVIGLILVLSLTVVAMRFVQTGYKCLVFDAYDPYQHQSERTIDMLDVPSGKILFYRRSPLSPPNPPDRNIYNDHKYQINTSWGPTGQNLYIKSLDALQATNPQNYGQEIASDVLEVTWSPDGHYVAYVTQSSRRQFSISVINTNVGSNYSRLLSANNPTNFPQISLTWSADSTYFAVSVADGSYLIFNPSDLGLVQSEVFSFPPIWSPSGHYLAGLTDDSTLVVLTPENE